MSSLTISEKEYNKVLTKLINAKEGTLFKINDKGKIDIITVKKTKEYMKGLFGKKTIPPTNPDLTDHLVNFIAYGVENNFITDPNKIWKLFDNFAPGKDNYDTRNQLISLLEEKQSQNLAPQKLLSVSQLKSLSKLKNSPLNKYVVTTRKLGIKKLDFNKTLENLKNCKSAEIVEIFKNPAIYKDKAASSALANYFIQNLKEKSTNPDIIEAATITLDQALQNRNKEIVELMIIIGGKLNLALNYAAQQGNVNHIKILFSFNDRYKDFALLSVDDIQNATKTAIKKQQNEAASFLADKQEKYL